MLGYWATGSPARATSPTMTVMMAMTMATIGRLMKKRYMALPPAAFGCGARPGSRAGGQAERPRLNRHPLFHLLHTFGDHHLARLEARLDFPKRSHPLARLYHAQLHLVVGAQHRQLVAPLQFQQAALRHQQRPLPGAQV